MTKKLFITTSAGKIMGGWEQQLGNAAILISSIKTLEKLIPDAEVSTDIQLSEEFCKKYGIKSLSDVCWEDGYIYLLESLIDLFRCSIWRFLQKFLRLNIRIITKGKKLREYANADIMISLVGDTYSNDGVHWSRLVKRSLDLLTVRLLGRPVILFAVSPGPFYPKPMLLLAKFTLNRMSLIITREQLSKDYLKKIGVNKTLTISTACPAFLLRPVSKERVKEILSHEAIDKNDRPLIGITLAEYNFYSCQTWDTTPPTSKDLSPYTPVVKYLLDDLKANVILIPHVYSRDQLTGKHAHGYDYTILQYLYHFVDGDKYKGRLKLTEGLYSPSEVKGIIGQFDLFISGRLHAGIAALSQAVPTILLAYGRKHYGVAKLLNQEKYVCPGRDPEEMMSIVRKAWENREEIKRLLQEKLVGVRELAKLNFEIVKEIVDRKKEEGNHILKGISDAWVRKGECLHT